MKAYLFAPLLALAVSQFASAQNSCSCAEIAKRGVTLIDDGAEPQDFEWGRGVKILSVGGHASHDFQRWFNEEDSKTLRKDPPVSINYTDRPKDIAPALENIDVLYLSLNQPMADEATHKAIEAFIERGGGLVVAHAATWKNWGNWPTYYEKFIGGFTQSHDPYGEFEVEVTERKHPVMENVRKSFDIEDELYHHNVAKDAKIEVVAEATSPKDDRTFPIVWTVEHPKAKIVCLTLGHDGKSHEDKNFQRLLRNAVKYVTPEELAKASS